MTEKKVRIRIVSSMKAPDGSLHETKNARSGMLKEEADGSLSLAYEDVQDGERAGVLLMMTEKNAKMRRQGEMTGTLNFEPGRRTPGVYATVYGEIPVAVYTRNVRLSRMENGGELVLDYDVFVGGEKTSSAVMTITWRG